MNKIENLRDHLFDTLAEVKAGKMPLDKAKVICEVAQSIINSAKVEVDFVKAINATKGSGFIPIEDKN